jgi:hypothetical protein
MDNGTSYELSFVCPSRELLDNVISYLRRKKDRWDAWEQRGKTFGELLERVGGEHAASVVSSGFDCGEVQVDEDGGASAVVASWANEVLDNICISGEHGELADLVAKFPFLDISGTYDCDDAGGDICGFDKC